MATRPTTTDLDGARVLVAGASGVLGGRIGEALHGRGARVVAAGRDPGRTGARAEAWGTAPVPLDVVDEDSCSSAVAAAADQLGGLDGLVVAVGVAGFGPAADTPAEVSEELFAVNVLGPMHLVRAALPRLPDAGFAAVLSAVLADSPTTGMADYSAAKAALAAWLGVLRREVRPRAVLDVRPPHLDTGLADRPLAGTAPSLPAGHDVDEVVALTVQGIEERRRELVWDRGAGGLVLR